MAEQPPPPIGESDTAFQLYVLRLTVAEHEKTIASLVDTIHITRSGAAEVYRQAQSAIAEEQRTSALLEQHLAEARAIARRVRHERDQVVAALRALVEVAERPMLGDRDPAVRRRIEERVRLTRELLTVIDAQQPT